MALVAAFFSRSDERFSNSCSNMLGSGSMSCPIPRSNSRRTQSATTTSRTNWGTGKCQLRVEKKIYPENHWMLKNTQDLFRMSLFVSWHQCSRSPWHAAEGTLRVLAFSETARAVVENMESVTASTMVAHNDEKKYIKDLDGFGVYLWDKFTVFCQNEMEKSSQQEWEAPCWFSNALGTRSVRKNVRFSGL